MRVSTTPSFRLLLSFVQMDPFGPVAADGIGRQRDVAFLIGAAGRFHGGRVGDGPALAQRRIDHRPPDARSEEHTSELQSLMRISYAVFCLKKKNSNTTTDTTDVNTHEHEKNIIR